MINMVNEVWKEIPEFPNYQISNLGNIYSLVRDIHMSTSLTTFGHVKITLTSEWTSERYTRSVAQLVAEAFVEPPTPLCDRVVILDGVFTNLVAENLVWRPQWFVWKYTRQLKNSQPMHYKNLPIVNIVTGEQFENVIDVGMSEGLLFADVWRSTYTGASLFPTKSIFEVIK